MNVVDIYDYYFLDRPRRRSGDPRCDFVLCPDSVVYRRLAADETVRDDGHEFCDILEYMQYNASNETGLPAYYSCCINYGGGHVCNAIPIMIGSRLERCLIEKLCGELGLPFDRLYDERYLHKVYASTFMTNGTFYYSVFRESNNNKMCHNTRSKFRGEETVAYFYDTTYNRGIKLFTDGGQNGRLKMNDRDGKEIADVAADTLSQLYAECLRNPRHYTLDVKEVVGFFGAVKREGFAGIDDFKNKIYTNYSIALNACLDKLHPTVVSHPKWNASLMTGRVNLGISQRLSYPKSKNDVKKQNEKQLKMSTGVMSTGYLVQSQRRRNTRKTKQNEQGVEEDADDAATAVATDTAATASVKCTQTALGSNEMKVNNLIDRLENVEKNGPSMFSQMTVSYLPFVRQLSATVQKLQVEHVHAESSKTVPKDAAAFICMKYVGNISTAGKNMLFTSRVHVSYGHAHEVIENIENGILSLLVTTPPTARYNGKTELSVSETPCRRGSMRIVINNAVTKYSLTDKRHLLDFMMWLKCTVHRYAWIKPTGKYLCLYFFEGVPLLEYRDDERLFGLLNETLVTDTGVRCLKGAKTVCFTRRELELIRDWVETNSRDGGEADEVEPYNRFVSHMFRSDGDTSSQPTERSRRKQREAVSSFLASQLDQYTDYTPPSKRSVSVNARKSACVNVYFLKAASLIRGFAIFTDPDGYEKRLAERAYEQHGTPVRVTLEQFRLMREDYDNCPQPRETADDDGEDDVCYRYALKNFYMMRTIFADIDGYNVEDANVMDESVDLCLQFSYSFSLTFFDETARGVHVSVPPREDCVRVCGWNEKGEPSAVMFLVCTVRTDGSGRLPHLLHDNSAQTEPDSTNGVCQKSLLGVVVGDSNVHFPPFRKLSVILNKDGTYHVYFIRNDAVILRAIKKQKDHWTKTQEVTAGDPYRTVEEVNPYHVLDSLETKVFRFAVSKENGSRGSVITVDFRAHGRTDKYDGIKVVNSFGQKGLAVIKDLRPYLRDGCREVEGDSTAPTTTTPPCTPVQLVMNVCSFVSRQPIGQYLQMKKNFSTDIHSAADEPCLAGFSPVFFTESEPTTKTCLVRLDEMMRSVMITGGLTMFQNVKSSLDNIYNLDGLLCPQRVRQILGLYRCYGVSYEFSGDTYVPYSTRQEVQDLLKLFDTCLQNIQETVAKKSICSEKRRKPVGHEHKPIVKKAKINVPKM